MDKFSEKVVNLCASLMNTYKDEESRDYIDQLEMDKEDITEDFTAMLYSMWVIYRKMVDDTEDIIGFTHLLNRLAIQHIMENEEENEDV